MATDLVTQMQLKVNDICRAYFTSIGRLQNEASEVPLQDGKSADYCQPLATELAQEVVRMHGEMEELIDALEKAHSSGADQEERMRVVQTQHAEVVDQLRQRTEQAEEIRKGLRRDLNDMIQGMRAADDGTGEIGAQEQSMPMVFS